VTTISPNSSYEYSSPDRLVLMLFIAVAIHALIILGVSFEAIRQEPPDQSTETLDITIVNKKETPPPEDYDYQAESSQDGGGNTQEKVRPTEQMVEQAPPPAAAPELQPEPAPVLTRDTSEQKIKKPEESAMPQPQDKLNATELINRSVEMLTLNQQINQSLQAYSKTPRSKYISARTQEFKYANYMRDWVTKVERVGDLNYPDAARRQNLSGSLIVEVALYADGTVREIKILRPSGHKLLDDAAIRIVRLAAPFPEFPEEIRKETDVLYITRTWVFNSNRLQGR
jgi:protein TonB